MIEEEEFVLSIKETVRARREEEISNEELGEAFGKVFLMLQKSLGIDEDDSLFRLVFSMILHQAVFMDDFEYMEEEFQKLKNKVSFLENDLAKIKKKVKKLSI